MLRRALLPLALLLLAPALAFAQPAHVTLDQLVRELSRDPRAPAVIDAMLADMGTRPGAGALLTPEQRGQLRTRLLEALRTGDASGLERSPALTVGQMGAAVTVLEAANAVNPRPAATDGAGAPPTSARPVREPLGIPVLATGRTEPAMPPAQPGQPSPLAALGIEKRHVPDADLAARGPDSTRMAEVLDRLSVNPPGRPRAIITHDDGSAMTPVELLRLLKASGHTIEVRDARMFADFAGLRSNGRDVAASMWADTEIAVPGRGTLKVPVTHSQHELVVRGPTVNVDVSFFMGIDGEARFRPMLDSRAGWTGRRIAHEYTGDRAIEALRVAGEVRRAFEEKRAANPQLPYGGYFALGVCNDSNAFVEHALTGRTTLYPLTRDLRFYQGPGEIDRIARAMPVDGRGAPADLERVLASLPVTDTDDLVFPELRADLRALEAARTPVQQGPREGLEDAVEGASAPEEPRRPIPGG